MVTDIGRKAAIKKALNPGFDLVDGEIQQLTSNTDEKITVYSMQNGEPKQILKIDAERVLLKTFADGRPMHWYPGLPGEPPSYTKGTVRCYLDPAFDERDGAAGFDRAWLDSTGLAGRTCNMMAPDKQNQKFRSIYDRDDHTQKKHRNEWKIIQAALERERRSREESERRADREAMLALAGSVARPRTGRPRTDESE